MDEMHEGSNTSVDPETSSSLNTGEVAERGVVELAEENERLQELITQLQEENTQLAERIQDLERRLIKTEEARDTALNESTIDSLTGILNRRGIDERLESIDLARYKGQVAIVMMDLDRLKPVNDTHGHEAGDKVLKAFANFLKKNFRRNDDIGRIGDEEPDSHVGRKGGDEFELILRGDGPSFKETIMSRFKGMEAGWEESCVVDLREEVMALGTEGKDMTLGFSYGVAFYDTELDGDLHETRKRSDDELYMMKREKRGALQPSPTDQA